MESRRNRFTLKLFFFFFFRITKATIHFHGTIYGPFTWRCFIWAHPGSTRKQWHPDWVYSNEWSPLSFSATTSIDITKVGKNSMGNFVFCFFDLHHTVLKKHKACGACASPEITHMSHTRVKKKKKHECDWYLHYHLNVIELDRYGSARVIWFSLKKMFSTDK